VKIAIVNKQRKNISIEYAKNEKSHHN